MSETITAERRKSRTKRRIQFINKVLELMGENNFFDEINKSRTEKEGVIQKSVFLSLNRSLPQAIAEIYEKPLDEAKDIVSKKFLFEANPGTIVHNYSFFATSHRPDAILDMEDMRLVFEIKKGSDGFSIRSGIGQSIVYSTQFDFTLFFYVDCTPGRDIRNSLEAAKEKALIQSLWDNYNIKFFVV